MGFCADHRPILSRPRLAPQLPMVPQNGCHLPASAADPVLRQQSHLCTTMRMQGSGLSEGEWVTLGALEVDDLTAVVAFLRARFPQSLVALWGRSMGAVTCLLHSQTDPSIAGMVTCFSRGHAGGLFRFYGCFQVRISLPRGAGCQTRQKPRDVQTCSKIWPYPSLLTSHREGLNGASVSTATSQL